MTAIPAIDAWCNPFDERGIRTIFIDNEEVYFMMGEQWGRTGNMQFFTPEEWVAKMDEEGVAAVCVPSLKMAFYRRRAMASDIEHEHIAGLCERDAPASLNAIAMACFGFFTLRRPPLLSSPCLYSCMTRSTVFFCGLLCLAIVSLTCAVMNVAATCAAQLRSLGRVIWKGEGTFRSDDGHCARLARGRGSADDDTIDAGSRTGRPPHARIAVPLGE